MFVCVIIKKEDNAYIYSWNFTTNTYKKNDKVNQSILFLYLVKVTITIKLTKYTLLDNF